MDRITRRKTLIKPIQQRFAKAQRMYIQKHERIIIKIGILLLIIGSIIEGIRYIRYGEHPELKEVKIERLQR